MIALLHGELGLAPSHAIVDLGSGTGLSARLFLEYGNVVYGIEPNAEMRAAGEAFLARFARFHSIAGTAEETTLPSACVDFAVAGQAFHWFDPARTKRELARIMRRGGKAILIWNSWHAQETPFLRDYRDVVHRWSLDKSAESRHSQELLLASIDSFFAPEKYTERTLENGQSFDFEGLAGRVRSASYAPKMGHPNYGPMMRELKEIFDRHQIAGQVPFEMKTQVFWGDVHTCAEQRD